MLHIGTTNSACRLGAARYSDAWRGSYYYEQISLICQYRFGEPFPVDYYQWVQIPDSIWYGYTRAADSDLIPIYYYAHSSNTLHYLPMISACDIQSRYSLKSADNIVLRFGDAARQLGSGL